MITSVRVTVASNMSPAEAHSCLVCKSKIHQVSSSPHPCQDGTVCRAEGHSRIRTVPSGRQEQQGQSLSNFIGNFFRLSSSCGNAVLCCSCCIELSTLYDSFFKMRKSITQNSPKDVSTIEAASCQSVIGSVLKSDASSLKEMPCEDFQSHGVELVLDVESRPEKDSCSPLHTDNDVTREGAPSASVGLEPRCSDGTVTRRVSSRIKAKQSEEPITAMVSPASGGISRKRTRKAQSSSTKPRKCVKVKSSSKKKKLKPEPEPDKSSDPNDELPIVLSATNINVHRTPLSQNERQMKLRYFRRKLKYNYPCWHCDLHFEELELCANHTEEIHVSGDEQKMMCPTCCKVSKNKRYYEYHVYTCGEFSKDSVLARAMACNVCPRKFLRKADYERHMETHAEKEVSCDLCSYRGPTEANVEAHKSRQHVNNKPENGSVYMYSCDQCKKLYSSYQSLRSHVKFIHTEGGKEKLKEMARQARIKAKLRGKKRKGRHTRTSFICTICGVDCMSNMRFLSHMKMLHPEECKEGDYVCETCGKTFHYRAALYSHTKKVHVDERPFICDQCGKAYKTNQNLKDHLSHTHSEEGRLAYNAKMRLHQQRRKLLAAEIEKRKNQNQAAQEGTGCLQLPYNTMQSLANTSVAPTVSYHDNAHVLNSTIQRAEQVPFHGPSSISFVADHRTVSVPADPDLVRFMDGLLQP